MFAGSLATRVSWTDRVTALAVALELSSVDPAPTIHKAALGQPKRLAARLIIADDGNLQPEIGSRRSVKYESYWKQTDVRFPDPGIATAE